MTLTLTVDDDFETSTLNGTFNTYRNNIQRTETITKQIIEIEMLREEKVAKHNTRQI